MSTGEHPNSQNAGWRNLERIKLMWQPRQRGEWEPNQRVSAPNSKWRETAATNAAAARKKKAKAEAEASEWLAKVKARKTAR